MTDHSVIHSTFTLERTYPVDTAKVFAAWSDPATKRRWFAGGDTSGEYSMDFRVGGREVTSGDHEGQRLTFTTIYADIIDGERITYTSTMQSGDVVTTVSLTTVEFVSTGDATKLVLTEHGAYLDGHEEPEWREEGTSSQLDSLTTVLS